MVGIVKISSYILKLNIIPTKYLIIGYIVALAIFIILMLLMYKNKKNKLKIASYIISTILSIILIVCANYINNTYKFLTNSKVGEYETLQYSVIVSRESEYKTIEDLKEKN